MYQSLTQVALKPINELNTIGVLSYANTDIDAVKLWLNEFLDSDNTLISYRQTAERFLLWCAQNSLTLKMVMREDIQAYQKFLSNPSPAEIWCGPAKPRHHTAWRPFVKGLSASSIKLNLQILTSLYEYLVQCGYLTINPFKIIKNRNANLTSHKPIERFLNLKQWEYLQNYILSLPSKNHLQLLTAKRIKWVFTLLYLSGCRRHEIIQAKMSDFFQRNGLWWLKVTGKGNKYGEIPVTEGLLSALIQYRQSLGLKDFPAQTETNIALINNLDINNLKPITDSMLYKLIRSTCKKVADIIINHDPTSAFVLEKVSTHWLRHTSATHQVDAGVDIRMVKANLRHSLLETTMKYQHTEADKRHEETSNKFKVK